MTEFHDQDLSGARFRKVNLAGARLRMADLSGAQLRDVDLTGASFEGAYLDGLTIDGVEVEPLIRAELEKRQPARVWRRADDPDGLRRAWAELDTAWEATYARVATLAPDAVEQSVEDEWTFTQTLRHLVSATDTWLGPLLNGDDRLHPWGLPFDDIGDFVDVSTLGLELDATPSYAAVLELRRARFGQVRDFLAAATAPQLEQAWVGPAWAGDDPVPVRRRLQVVISEEIEHHRFAERDLDVIAAR